MRGRVRHHGQRRRNRPGGAILIGGDFVQVGNVHRAHLARFTPEGRVRRGSVVGVGDTVRCIGVLPDNSLLIGEDFTAVQVVARLRMAGISRDGSMDPT